MVNAHAIACPIKECALCEKIKQELDDMEAAAILRGVALDMELDIKRRAVKYLSEDDKQDLLLLGGGDMTDFFIGEFDLAEIVRSVHANGKLDDFLADVELSRAEFPQLEDDLYAMQCMSLGRGCEQTFRGRPVDHALRRWLVERAHIRDGANKKLLLECFDRFIIPSSWLNCACYYEQINPRRKKEKRKNLSF